MRIRKFRKDDAVEIARMHRNTIKYVNSRDYTPTQIRAWATRPTAKKFRENPATKNIMVATEADKIVGFVWTAPEEIQSLYVHKDWLGKGIGAKLLKKAEQILKKKGYNKVKSYATKTAEEFYKKHGFIKRRAVKHCMGAARVTCICMSKRL